MLLASGFEVPACEAFPFSGVASAIPFLQCLLTPPTGSWQGRWSVCHLLAGDAGMIDQQTVG